MSKAIAVYLIYQIVFLISAKIYPFLSVSRGNRTHSTQYTHAIRLKAGDYVLALTELLLRRVIANFLWEIILLPLAPAAVSKMHLV